MRTVKIAVVTIACLLALLIGLLIWWKHCDTVDKPAPTPFKYELF